MAVDSRGVLYVSNGNAGGLGGGKLYSFNPDLTERWSTPIDGNLNQGGPVLATDGTLIIASTGTDVRAYRTATICAADFNSDGFIDFFDYDDYVNCFETGTCPPGKTADSNGDGFVDFFDYDAFVAAFESGC
jgi:outer membrane protein assembly factor BamB